VEQILENGNFLVTFVLTDQQETLSSAELRPLSEKEIEHILLVKVSPGSVDYAKPTEVDFFFSFLFLLSFKIIIIIIKTLCMGMTNRKRTYPGNALSPFSMDGFGRSWHLQKVRPNALLLKQHLLRVQTVEILIQMQIDTFRVIHYSCLPSLICNP